MRNKWLYLVFCGALLLGGCAKKEAAGPTATLSLRDGTTITGTVTKSDTTAITLTTANGETRTYPMSQVDSISYANGAPGGTGEDTTASTAAPAAPPPATTTNAGSSSKMAPMAPPPPKAAPKAPAAPAVPTRTVAAGTKIAVRNSDRIQAGVAEAGQTFPAVIVDDVMGSDGGLAIPKGSDAMLIVRSSEGQGKVQGRSEISLDLDYVVVRGHRYNLDTQDIVEQGTAGVGKNKRSAKFIGGGAVLGTIIGAVAGGGKGAAIGAAAGAGAGAGAQALTRGKNVSVPSESVLNFELDAPLQIRLTN
ncbi:MAG TPA: hypothetical protein VHA14_15115 [Bryobacteraceae bacterium]|nr:hypothetical protein [Bryobacteraceae bacterium]